MSLICCTKLPWLATESMVLNIAGFSTEDLEEAILPFPSALKSLPAETLLMQSSYLLFLFAVLRLATVCDL